MLTTPLHTLSYPEDGDAPDGPGQVADLALDVDGWISRLRRCTSDARPTGVPVDYVVRETDTGVVSIHEGAGAWSTLIPANIVSGGGGGGGTDPAPASSAVSASYAATGAGQGITTGANIVVSFPTAWRSNAQVVRETSGAGHRFKLVQARHWIITVTLRFSQNAVGGRLFKLVTATGDVLAEASGPVNTDAPWTVTLAAARFLQANTYVQVIARHNSSTSPLALENTDADGGNAVHIDLVGV